MTRDTPHSPSSESLSGEPVLPASLDTLVASWRGWMQRHDAVNTADLDELESHLLDTVDHFIEAGLTADEAFLVAVKRLGGANDLSREYAREHSERLWKQLVLTGDGTDSSGGTGTRADTIKHGEADTPDRPFPLLRRANGLGIALLLGIGAGLALKAVSLATNDPSISALNGAVIVLPFLALWFAQQRKASVGVLTTVGMSFVVVGLALNLYPFANPNQGDPVDEVISAIKILALLGSFVALWLTVGVAYTGAAWREERPAWTSCGSAASGSSIICCSLSAAAVCLR